MAQTTSPIIDTHLHILQVSRLHYHWLDTQSPLHRDITLNELADEWQLLNVRGGILIEASNTTAETDFLLAICQSSAVPLGVIAWVDADSADAPTLIRHYAQYSAFKGIRLNWFAPRPHSMALQCTMQAIAEKHLVVEILLSASCLAHVCTFTKWYPQVTFVLNHCGGLDLAHSTPLEWVSALKAFSALEHVALKLSAHYALPTQRTFVDVVRQLFGTRRLLFGSNFPMHLPVSYRQVCDTWHHTIRDTELQTAIFHHNPLRLYQLQLPTEA
jgi:L-fuconolactonase